MSKFDAAQDICSMLRAFSYDASNQYVQEMKGFQVYFRQFHRHCLSHHLKFSFGRQH